MINVICANLHMEILNLPNTFAFILYVYVVSQLNHMRLQCEFFIMEPNIAIETGQLDEVKKNTFCACLCSM